jgi:hypothetical protein
MENLAPTLEWIMRIRLKVETGSGVLSALKETLLSYSDELSADMRKLVIDVEMGSKKFENNQVLQLNPYRRNLFLLLARGIQGEPILNHLRELENETLFACEQEVEKFLAQLPIKVLVVVLLFQFPAFLILMLAPLITHLLGSF